MVGAVVVGPARSTQRRRVIPARVETEAMAS
jgi:hypothetical protein